MGPDGTEPPAPCCLTFMSSRVAGLPTQPGGKRLRLSTYPAGLSPRKEADRESGPLYKAEASIGDRPRALTADQELKRSGAFFSPNLCRTQMQPGSQMAQPPLVQHTCTLSKNGWRGREGRSVHAESDLTPSCPEPARRTYKARKRTNIGLPGSLRRSKEAEGNDCNYKRL